MQDIVTKITEKLKLTPELQLKRAIRGLPGYTVADLISALINTSSIEDAAVLLGYSTGPIKQSIREILTPLYPERRSAFGDTSGGKRSWRYELLAAIDHRLCWSCKNVLDYTKFYRDSNDPLGISGECSTCHSYRVKLAKTDIANRTPNWADMEAIRKFYNACPKGMQVDHIIPLRGKYVSGLHTEANLQYLSQKDNLAKSNSYTIL